jgi:ABC-2 type transport system ATP-binding protein
MKVGEQCLYLAQMKVSSKAEAKKQLEYWSKDWEFKDGGTRKSKSFLRNGTENSICSLCIAQAKTIILMSLFWF